MFGSPQALQWPTPRNNNFHHWTKHIWAQWAVPLNKKRSWRPNQKPSCGCDYQLTRLHFSLSQTPQANGITESHLKYQFRAVCATCHRHGLVSDMRSQKKYTHVAWNICVWTWHINVFAKHICMCSNSVSVCSTYLFVGHESLSGWRWYDSKKLHKLRKGIWIKVIKSCKQMKNVRFSLDSPAAT